ncbi:hypothetical protein BGW37DRAFT_468738 [Umbelopsis sp. PMI_123]|nr:hypothetical protein BGW37DRAFT_468738 [Umbelopsis sp. PMI_123]
MTRKSFLSLVLAVFVTLLLQTYAFCVYNSMASGNVLYLEQSDGYGNDPTSAFKCNYLDGGNRACCSYHDKDCVAGGDPNHTIRMAVELSNTEGFITYKLWVIDFPGGGWINVSGITGHEVADAYDADGNHLAHYK